MPIKLSEIPLMVQNVPRADVPRLKKMLVLNKPVPAAKVEKRERVNIMRHSTPTIDVKA